MGLVHKLIPSFATGEVSPAIYSRVDLEKYQAGLKYCRNAYVLPYGSVLNRSGSVYCGETKTSTSQSRLIEFQYNTEQAYMLEFGNAYMRVIKNGGYVLSGGTPYQITTPYSAAQAMSLQYTQSANKLYLFHPSFLIREITRTADASWTIATHDLQQGPLLEENIEATTLTLAGSIQAATATGVSDAGDWTASAGTLDACVDDYPAASGDYIECGGANYCELTLTSLSTPSVRDGHVLKIYAGNSAANTTLSLYQASTLIYAVKLRTNATVEQHVVYIPKAAAETITSYSSLRVRIASAASMRVYSLELQVPMPTSGGTPTARNDVSLFEGDSVAVAASASVFASGHVGSVWALRYTANARSFTYRTPNTGAFQSTAWPVEGDWTLTFDPDSSVKVDEQPMYLEKSIDGGRSWYKRVTFPVSSATTSSSYSGSEADPCLFRITRENSAADMAVVTLSMQGKEKYAYFKMAAYSSGTSMTATLQTDFSQPGTPFETWSEAAWSAVRGYPVCGTFYQDRFMTGGTTYQPQTVWGSKTGDYNNHGRSIPVKDDDGITANIISRQVNAIRSMAAMNDLVIGTAGAVWKLSPAGDKDVLAPTSIRVRFQAQYGAASLPLMVVGNTCLMVQDKGTKVRDLSYSIASDSYDGSNLTILASHLLEGYSVTDWCYQPEPYSILWLVRSDGKFLSLTYDRAQNVWAWGLHEMTGGVVESMKCLSGSTEDDVYMIVRRTVNSATKRYVEVFSSRQITSVEDAKIMDSCITYSGAAATTITGLAHLEGKAVAVLANGVPVFGKTVSSAQITIPTAATKVQVGIGYNSTVETLNLELNLKDGSALDRTMGIPQVMVHVQNSCNFQIGVDAGALKSTELPSSLYTGEETVFLPTGYDTNGRLVMYQDKPLPFCVNSMVARVDVGG